MRSRSRQDPNLLAYALRYAELGWPVFPLIPRDKQPLTRDGFKSATCDPAVLDAWWEEWPTANIGLATGHAFDVLDVDGATGVETLRKVLDSVGVTYRHDGPTVLTGKGWHFYFRPTGQGNRSNILGDKETKTNLDYRGLGGYVVGPPSLHPLGHRYAWDGGRDPRIPIPPPPEWLTVLLARGGDRDDNPKIDRLAVIRANPHAPAAQYLDLVEHGALPKDQLPRQLRQRFERPDILEVCARLGIKLRRGNGYFMASCVYHNDPDPSMAVYPKNHTFYCYGCEAHGDSWDLLNGKHI